jgi:DNA polymerase III psi subunit
MALNALQVQRLQAMGLTVWVPRSEPPIESLPVPSIEAIPSSVASSTYLPCLVLVVEPTSHQTLSPALSDLMSKILKAMSLDPAQCQTELLAQASELGSREDLSQRQDIVVFGDGPIEERIDGLIVLPALSRMLADRACKAQAWSQIKHWLSQRSV